jgi:hypothetical protein
MRRAPDRLLDRAQAQRRAGKNVGQPALDRFVQPGARHDLVEQPPALEFARLEPSTREHHAHREPERHLALQLHHPAIERQIADARLGEAEGRLLRHDRDIAAQHHLEAAAKRVAVDTADDRNVQRVAKGQAAEAMRTWRHPVIETALRRAGQIGAGAERPIAGAGQDDHADVALTFKPAPDRLQLRLGRRVDRVELVGSVDGDARDVIGDLEPDGHDVTVAPARPSSARISSVCSPRRGGRRRIARTGASDR